MQPVTFIIIAWVMFGGSHLALSFPPIRTPLAKALGPAAFTLLYSAITVTTLSVLAGAIALFGDQGPAAFNLELGDWFRWTLGALAAVGVVLSTAGFVHYPRSAIALLARRTAAGTNGASDELPGPEFVHRLTRHPFFVGLAMVMGVHVMLAKTLAMAVFFAGFLLLAVLGIPLLDYKLTLKHGTIYKDYRNKTHIIPLWLSPTATTQRDNGRAILITVIASIVLILLHPLWIFANGAIFVMLINLGGIYAVYKQLQRARRVATAK